MLPADELADANGILQTAREGLRLVAPLAGAALFAAAGGAAVALLDVADVRARGRRCSRACGSIEPRARAAHRRAALAELAAGARHLLARRPAAPDDRRVRGARCW